MHGGSHTTFGGDWCQEKWDTASEEEKKKITYDPRWAAWPQKIYTFKEKPEEVKELLLFLAEADNANYQIVIAFSNSILFTL